MSEDEIIEILKRITVTSFNTDTIYDTVGKINDAIQGMLDLYNKEKEKNKEFIDLHYVPYEQYVTELNEINEKWKDKIRAKIEELEKIAQRSKKEKYFTECEIDCSLQVQVLKELLEEE